MKNGCLVTIFYEFIISFLSTAVFEANSATSPNCTFFGFKSIVQCMIFQCFFLYFLGQVTWTSHSLIDGNKKSTSKSKDINSEIDKRMANGQSSRLQDDDGKFFIYITVEPVKL